MAYLFAERASIQGAGWSTWTKHGGGGEGRRGKSKEGAFGGMSTIKHVCVLDGVLLTCSLSGLLFKSGLSTWRKRSLI
jgi:hypothetical protein